MASRIERSDRQSRPQGCEQGDAQRPRLPASRGPSGRRSAEQRYELAALHSITSSARKKNDSEIVRMRALADLTLMISSNVTAVTGKTMLARGVL